MTSPTIVGLGLHLKVRDIEKSRAFYESLGFKPVFAYGDDAFRKSFGEATATAPEAYRGVTFGVSDTAQFEIAEGHIAVPDRSVFETPVATSKLSGMFRVDSLVPVLSNPLVEIKFPVRHYYWNTIEAAFRDPDGFVIVMIVPYSEPELTEIRKLVKVEEVKTSVSG